MNPLFKFIMIDLNISVAAMNCIILEIMKCQKIYFLRVYVKWVWGGFF